MSYQQFPVTPARKAALLEKFQKLPEVVPLHADPEFFSLVVSLGIQQEVGTIHDELSVFLYDADTSARIPRERLRAEVIVARRTVRRASSDAGRDVGADGIARPTYGVRVWAEGVTRIDPRVSGLLALAHPTESYDAEGRLAQLVFYPELITEIAALEGAELVSVKPWGLNTIFGGFDPSRPYYEGNMWEFINVDAVRYAGLLERRQIVFWGTHDLVSHVAGVRRQEWPALAERGRRARELFEAYFAGVRSPAPAALVLPYALGMLLDDLAQPPNYRCPSREHVVELLNEAIRARAIRADTRSFLLKYPPSIERLIAIARSRDAGLARREGAEAVAAVVSEIRRHSWDRDARGDGGGTARPAAMETSAMGWEGGLYADRHG